jgi:hypothetical protein
MPGKSGEKTFGIVRENRSRFSGESPEKHPLPVGQSSIFGRLATAIRHIGRAPGRGFVMFKEFKEQRKSPRPSFNRFARIQCEASGPSRDCLIVDMSQEGVRLHVENFEVPQDFTLILSEGLYPRRQCRVTWRLGYEIGAKFTDIERAPALRSARAAA